MRPLIVAIAMMLAPMQAPGVQGIVVDAATRQPVPAAAVLLIRPDALAAALLATTDDGGRFTFPKVAPGDYRVRAERDGYLRSEVSSVTVGSGAAVSDVVLTLVPTAVISGRVTDQYGEPVSRVYIRALTTRVVAETRTNDLGEYRLFNLPPDVYIVSAEPYPGPSIQGGFMQTPTPPHPDAPGEGVGRSSLTAVLDAGAFIDPRALTRETYPTVFYPGTTERKTATPLKAGPGARLDGIDLRLVVR